MSDEKRFSSDDAADLVDECAPTEREPALVGVATPSRGVALSVLWWVEGEEMSDDDVPESERARH